MLTRAAIRAVAATFWSSAGGRSALGAPVDFERAVVQSLPMAIHRVPDLTTANIGRILARIGAPAAVDGAVRALRGCLIADAGVGLVLLDADDPEDEQRLTVAHEVAHFLLHYLAARGKAVTGLGPCVIAVLDRTRSPTRAELFSAAFRDLPIRPFRHALVRSGAQLLGQAAIMEAEADDLAIELLAPWELVRAMNPPRPDAIASRFGIPLNVATKLAAMAVPRVTEMGVTSLFGIK